MASVDGQILLCGACGRSNPAGFRFCGACGATLGRLCPDCGSTSPEGFAFCGRCGSRLDDDAVGGRPDGADARPAGRGGSEVGVEERKVVSVLYADLVSSTELASRLDPEELEAVLRPFFEAMAAEIGSHEGTVEKYIGDAIVAVFGHPVAREDHAERAVRAAVAMQARLANDSSLARPGERLAMRIAVNTSEVLAGPGSDRGGGVTGDAVSLAARLQALAPQGSVVVADRTRRLTRRAFAYRGLGDAAIKGFGQPIAVWEVVADGRPAVEPSEARPAFVGRDGELAVLRALYERMARSRVPTLVTLIGPPGMGKSRLADEFAGSITTARVVKGRCLSYGDGVAFWPLAEILKTDAGILDSDPPEVIIAKANGLLGPRFVGVTEALGTTQVLLSSIGIAPGTDPLAGLEPLDARRVIAAAWRRYFETMALPRPVIAFIEDIHWADASLLDLLESLASRVAGPLFLVCTARPEVLESRPGWGAGRADASSVTLAPLSDADGVELIRRLLAGEAPPDIVERIVRRAEGNPFYVGELLRMMVDDGSLERSTDGWRASHRSASSLPDTIQGVIASRIDLLSPAGKRAIQDASVVGRVFWPGAIARQSSAETVAAIGELIDKGLVTEHDGSAIDGERELAFNHILTRDVAYASVPKARRADAHGAVLDWMEAVTSGRDDEFAEILAHHASEAGDIERTARFAMLAGHRQRRVFAAEDAIRWYDRAIAALDLLASEPTALIRVEAMLSRGEARELLGRLGDARADYELALAAARTRPAGSREWLEGRALAAIVQVLWAEGRLGDADELLPRALAAAADQGADDLVARLSSGAGSVALLRGDPASAIALQRRALDVALAADDREGEAVARHGSAEAAFIVGPFDEGISQARRADDLFRQLGQRPLVHRNEGLTGALLWVAGQRDPASALATAGVAGCRDVGNRRDLASALTTLGVVAISLGDLGLAIRSADEAVAISGDIDAPRLRIAAYAWRCLALAECAAHERLRADVETGLSIVAETDEWVFRGPLLAARGWLEMVEGRLDAAGATFEEAAAAAGAPLPGMLVGRFQILAGEAVEDPALLRAASGRIAQATVALSPPFLAWAEFGVARASMVQGDAEASVQLARRAGENAAAIGETPIIWRSAVLLGRALRAAGLEDQAEASRAAAAAILVPMIAGVDDPELRAGFARRPEVASVTASAEPAPQA